ncbi:dTDP-4-dehydrorhamnose 3,5-epimerase family protein [Methylobacterium sp. OT2]|uniref:dTDP-4-dehydrorhamnose 3,5-epimerase family protein n=1 Tax=Methylobacterium sp. OT2 TaxID=2813779 RepID=UPI00197BFA14|nr:dTDP-4-dehydrorhamnose 3,5-epimerase family protein [Methylobacterium sp. OT2]MBN4094679.1 dTDP-4-dehydrorhamnose 3,5-epimerase family protein [Methylobacterium sp. OT2]
MTFEELPLAGAYRIGLSPHSDERGFFARTVCEDTLSQHGLVGRFQQSSVSFNLWRGTVRGMHYALAPHAETKLVRCTMGAIHDVIIDLRRSSPTYLQAVGVALSAENRAALYIPVGFAHGFQTLRDETEVLYMIDRAYVAEAARGLRWDDPAVNVVWPEPMTVIAKRDLSFPAWTGTDAVA